MAISIPEREKITYHPAAKDKLREAADLLEEKGWIQGRPVDGIGQHCAIGAIMEVCGAFSPTPDEVLCQKVIQLLQAHIGTPIISWNDRAGQTKTNVIETLRDCARG